MLSCFNPVWLSVTLRWSLLIVPREITASVKVLPLATGTPPISFHLHMYLGQQTVKWVPSISLVWVMFKWLPEIRNQCYICHRSKKETLYIWMITFLAQGMSPSVLQKSPSIPAVSLTTAFNIQVIELREDMLTWGQTEDGLPIHLRKFLCLAYSCRSFCAPEAWHSNAPTYWQELIYLCTAKTYVLFRTSHLWWLGKVLQG